MKLPREIELKIEKKSTYRKPLYKKKKCEENLSKYKEFFVVKKDPSLFTTLPFSTVVTTELKISFVLQTFNFL